MTLKELRQQSGRTAKEVANKLGVRVQSLYRYEAGDRKIEIEHALTLATLYDCTEREVIEAQLKSIAISSTN